MSVSPATHRVEPPKIRTRAADPGATYPRPTWAEYVEATIEAQGVGYQLGYQAGLRAAADHLDATALRDAATQVVLNAAQDMHVAAMRRPA